MGTELQHARAPDDARVMVALEHKLADRVKSAPILHNRDQGYVQYYCSRIAPFLQYRKATTPILRPQRSNTYCNKL